MTERVLVLTKRVPWYGESTGYYGMLPPALREAGHSVSVVSPRGGPLVRAIGRGWAWYHRLPRRNQALAFAEWEFLRRFDPGGGPALILSLEDHLPLLSLPRFQAGAPANLVGVIHFPPTRWTADMLSWLSRLRSALVLYARDREFFERYVGSGRVQVVPHGVDITYFTPGTQSEASDPRLLVSGQFGRDFALLADAFVRVREALPSCRLDIVGAHHVRSTIPVQRLSRISGVTIHPFCSDARLLSLYRSADVMLLPLDSAGANNALVEALACGLPIVATDVGGVREYGGETVFPVVPPHDPGAFAAAVLALLLDPARRKAVASASRRLAETSLAWPMVAARHRKAWIELGAG